jgi:hypothetical protein
MQVECVRAFGHHEPGDLAEVPDGASVDPVHWRPVTVDTAAADEAVARAKELLGGLAERVATPKEGMLWHPHQG